MENDEPNDMHISSIRAAVPVQGFCNVETQTFQKGKAVETNRSILNNGKSKILEEVTQTEDDDSENEMSIPSITMAEPIQGFYESEPTHFIKSLWKMVEDTETDSIISWSDTKESVIIWNEHELCLSLLPRFFKHNNYSSFIRQLNKYGFKKMNRYSNIKEYVNEMFQGGKEHLLGSFKNRCNQGDCSNSGLNLEQSCSEIMLEQVKGHMSEINKKHVENGSEPKFDMDPSYLLAKIEKLKSRTNTTKVEIMELRQQQESILSYLATTKEIVKRRAKDKQQKILIYLEKAFDSHVFCDQFIQLIRRKRELVSGRSAKKRRVDNLQSTNNFVMFNQAGNEEEVITVEPEVDKSVLDSVEYEGTPSEQQKAKEAVELGNEEEVIPVQTKVDKSVSDPEECEDSPSEQQKAKQAVEWGNGENKNEEEVITAETEIDKSVSVEYKGSPSKQHKTEEAVELRNLDLQCIDLDVMDLDTWLMNEIELDHESQAKLELAKYWQEEGVYEDWKC